MKIKAVFKGEDGSLAYRRNKEYNLYFRTSGNLIVISRLNGESICPYQSLKAFLANWEIING